MSKLKLMGYNVVSEMITIGITPEEYLPRINSLTAPAILIRELMYIGVECDYVIEDGDSFVLRCPEYSEHYNDFLEEFIQSFRYKSRRVQNIVESYKILSKRELKSVPISPYLVEQNTELRKEIEKLHEELIAHKEVNADLSRRNASLDDKLEELKVKCSGIEAENAHLKHVLNSFASEAAEEQEELNRYKSEVSDSLYSLQEELKEAARTLDCMIEDLTESD